MMDGSSHRHESSERDPAPPATTASMQSLLAQYFAEQAAVTPPAFDPARPEALSVPPMETQVAASFAALEAAVARPPAPAPQWPASAQALIDSLRAENDRLRAELKQQTEALHAALAQADSDVLTPALNRRAFVREVQRAMADCRRYGEDASLIYIDMDSFKSINDTWGHGAGDAALVYVAETLITSVREGDAVGRMGGDEFAVLLRRADQHASRLKALKLEAELAMGTFEYKGLYLKAGGSFGVRAWGGQATAEAWLSEADAAMFLNKKANR